MHQLDNSGAAFLLKHEGFVKRAYRCPAKVLTIGSGFTMRSKTARKYWIETRGRPLRRGDTITRAENMKLLRMASHEYGAPAYRALPGASLTEWTAGYSYTFNCGPGAANDKWFKLFQAGDKKGAASRLRRSRCTARGKPLRGLRIRRGHEAKLLLTGDYGLGRGGGMQTHEATETKPAKPNKELMEYQVKLNALGYNSGEADGWMGPITRQAVLKFQKKHPDLTNDGILGKATKVSIDRAMKAAQAGRKSAGAVAGAVVVTGAGAASQASEAAGNSHLWLYGLGAVIVAAIIYSAWKFWPEIEHKFAEWKET